MSKDFWTTAWTTLRQLDSGPPDSGDDSVLVAEISNDLVLQRYLFIHHAFADPAWLSAFISGGLFSNPPAVEHNADGSIRAYGWPALTYLLAVAPLDPIRAASVLESIHSDNWWVISDALAVAGAIEGEEVIAPILSLLAQWEATPAQWTTPDLLRNAVERLAASGGEGDLQQGVGRILDRFLEDGRTHYDVAEAIPDVLARTLAAAPSVLATTIEESLASLAVTDRLSRFRCALDDLDPDEPVDVLLAGWLDAAVREASNDDSYLTARRAARLAGARSDLLRSMGLRALTESLSVNRSGRLALRQLRHLADSRSVTSDDPTLPERCHLLGLHFELLDEDAQASLLARVVLLSDASPLDRYVARDLLSAMEADLGPSERLVLRGLVSDLGAVPPSRRTVSVSEWSFSQSPVTQGALEEMPVGTLLGHLRTPVVGARSEEWMAGSPERAFGQALQGIVGKRLNDFTPHLGEFADSARSESLIYFICLGLRDALREEGTRNDKRREAIVTFVHRVAARAQGVGFEPDRDERPYAYEAARAVADLMESTATWIVETSQPDHLLHALRWLASIDDPSRQDDVDQDPPSTAINSVRGEAIWAALLMRQRFWGSDAIPLSALQAGLDEILASNVRSESSPAVFSCYGRFLAPLVVHFTEFFDEHRATLLPHDETQTHIWATVLGSYLVFSGPHWATAEAIKMEYQLAAARLEDLEGTYLGKHKDRLLMHLLSLALPWREEAEAWDPLLHMALDNGGTEAATRAIADLSFAIEREGVDVPATWVSDFVHRRTLALAASRRQIQDSHRPNEPRALAELLMTREVPLDDGHSLLQSLLGLGAAPRVSDVVKYLATVDPSRTRSGLELLTRAVTGGELLGFARAEDPLQDLLDGYREHREDLWSLLNLMGSQGAFTFEQMARDLAPTDPE